MNRGVGTNFSQWQYGTLTANWMLLQLVKQTDIQATGVASSLVETIVQAGFKIQALSLGFDDDGGDDDEFIDYDPSSFSEEEEATAE